MFDEYIATPQNQCYLLLKNCDRLTTLLPVIYAPKPLGDDKVRDHCYIVGICRGAAHGKVRVIPQNMEKYLAVTVGQLNFFDSFQFTPKGLDVLAKTLADDEFRYLRESCTSNHFGLIRRKGVHPYDYMNSCNRFDETKLPSQDAFFSKLSGTQLECGLPLDVGQSQITTASTCNWMCLLLADFFEKFRATCLEFYSLDPVHYYTTPGLAWDAALRMSPVDLQLITDVDMYHFV